MSRSLIDHLFVISQTLLPHHLLSRAMHGLARIKFQPFKNTVIRFFIHRYKVDMSIAEQANHTKYADFNSFFTRSLIGTTRPVVTGSDEIACPVDGTVSQAGAVDMNRIYQAKGYNYSLEALLGGNSEHAAIFNNGSFATLYLSPKDYHRIHMPITGRLQQMIYVPGRLFSVNKRATCHVPNLFTRNERVISLFETEAGTMAMILVGALFVSSIETVWAESIPEPGHQGMQGWNYTNRQKTIILERGQEMGRFNMGSTVIVLFEAGRFNLAENIRPDTTVKMGQLLGTTTPAN